jgi:AraC-like DNA-binding protein
MYTTGEPFHLDIPGGYRSLMLTVPRVALASRLPKLERFTARTLGGASGISRLVGQLMRDAGELDNSVGEFALVRLGTPIVDMVALGLEAELSGESQAPSRGVQLLGRIKSRMQESIEDCDLDINQIANHLGVGVRTMNRLFAAEGTTAMHWLQQQRLHASYRLLVEGRADHVADAAISCGFSNLSHFSRVFKREFGVQPSSLLSKAG